MHDVIMPIDSRTTLSMTNACKLSVRACTAQAGSHTAMENTKSSESATLTHRRIRTQAHATVHVVKLGLLRVNIHVDLGKGQLILDGSLFQLEDTCGRFLSDRLAVSLKGPRCCGCCCCCCSCCRCCWLIQHDVRSVLTALSCLSLCL